MTKTRSSQAITGQAACNLASLVTSVGTERPSEGDAPVGHHGEAEMRSDWRTQTRGSDLVHGTVDTGGRGLEHHVARAQRALDC